MEVYLIRHGIAAERGTYSNDEQRPLTNKGHRKTAKVAQRLVKIGLVCDRLLTSPLIRAEQTAAIFQQAGFTSTVETHDFLKPEGKIMQWLTWQQEQALDAKIALVGHQPNLGNWTEMLLWGSVKGQIEVKKAGLVGLRLPEIGTPIARSTLLLHAAPKYLLG